MTRSLTHTHPSQLFWAALPIVAILAVAPALSACGDPYPPGSCVHAHHDTTSNEDTADPVECTDLTANYRVLSTGGQADTCDGTAGLTATYSVWYYGRSSGGYTLCLGDL